MATKSDIEGAAENLRILDEAQGIVGRDQAYDLGPAWYAPVLATGLGGVMMFGVGNDRPMNFVLGGIGVICLVIVCAHDHGRRKACPRFNRHMLVVSLGSMIVAVSILGLWGWALSSVGFERFFPTWFALGWLATTGFLLLIGKAVNRLVARAGLR